MVQIAFGGMVAEELFFGETSSGVAADLQAATDATCQMVGSLGMGSTLISAGALEVPGGANIVSKVLSTDAGRDEVEDLLRCAKAEAAEMIESNRHVVEALRDALLEREELVGSEILEVIASARPPADGTSRSTYPSATALSETARPAEQSGLRAVNYDEAGTAYNEGGDEPSPGTDT